MIASATLALLLRTCAPTVAVQTQAALVTVESSGEAFALHDNNTNQSYFPTDYGAAVTLTERLIRQDASRFGTANSGIDVGIAQIDTNNFASFGLTPALALDPCMNLRVGSLMLTTAYNREYASLPGIATSQRQQLALSRALQRYNSGKPTGDQQYVAKILLASQLSDVRAISTIAPTFSVLRASAPKATPHGAASTKTPARSAPRSSTQQRVAIVAHRPAPPPVGSQFYQRRGVADAFVTRAATTRGGSFYVAPTPQPKAKPQEHH